MKGHGSKFGRKKEAAIAALLTQKNYEEAARATGIDIKTLKRWMRLPEFIEEYRRARWEIVEQAYARIQQNSGAATSVLLKLMADPGTPTSSRIRAALGIFDLARLEQQRMLNEKGKPAKLEIIVEHVGQGRSEG